MAFDFSQLKTKFQQVITLVEDDLKQIKTGRAKPSLIEDIKAEAYGGYMAINELASINAADAQMLIVSPWDQSVMAGIEKALQKNNFNPAVDGNSLRIVIPALTGERRQEMIKQVAQHIESGKQMLRGERSEGKRQIEGQKNQPGVSEDDIKAEVVELDKQMHDFTVILEKLGEDKKKELETL